MDPIEKDKEITAGDAAIVPAQETGPAENEVVPTPSGEPAETVPPKYSDTFKNRIKSAYPDEEFADDETFYQKASEQLDNLEAYRNNNMEINKSLMAIFTAEPAVAEVLKDMIEGASFPEAVARHFSPEELTPKEGDPDREGWARNSEARVKRMEANELSKKTRKENDEFTMKEIQDFAKENDLTPDKANEILTKIGEVLDEIYTGKISKSFFNSMYKAFNYDTDVATAEDTGKIAGRNEQIVTKKEEKPSGDGLPVIANSNKTDTPAKAKSWIDTMIDTEKKKQIL